MKKLGLILSILLSLSALSVHAQRLVTSVEGALSDGLDEKTNIRFGVNVLEGLRLNDYFYLGAGVGFFYTDGLMTEITHQKLDGTFEPQGEIFDVSWAPNMFVRAKFNLSGKWIVSPFIVCDGGYSVRVGDKGSARMNTGWFVRPGVGCDLHLWGRTFSVSVIHDHFRYEYERLLTPHADTDPVNMYRRWTESLGVSIGISF